MPTVRGFAYDQKPRRVLGFEVFADVRKLRFRIVILRDMVGGEPLIEARQSLRVII
jgi:hypothetical protein